ncbi:HAMP domain-containing histidine kinase [bacterium]|nr:HAMP domain-containing histidine kinase [bacterium]
MGTAETSERAFFELPRSDDGAAPPAVSGHCASAALPESFLERNALWFCHFRWVVVAALTALGALGLNPELPARFGIRISGMWPFAAAATLLLTNVLFLVHARRLVRQKADHGAVANLWAQILTDLTVLTCVVHHVGSLETYVAFAYLFHIVLACIFLCRKCSFIIVVIACVLYVGCVGLESAGVLPVGGIYADSLLRDHIDHTPGLALANVSWAVLTWMVVWYLTSHLSAMVRGRDAELAQTNERLIAAREERRSHMLRTTHELKAPFSAIHANVQLLTRGHCGEMPEKAMDVLGRIKSRCERLANEIQEMLQLANLRSNTQGPPEMGRLDIAEAVRVCLSQAEARAQVRDVTIEAAIEPATVLAARDHVNMLLGNLILNAVNYSRPGGRVRVACHPVEGAAAEIIVEDEGIGIPPDKLPHIFDPYFRTSQAAQHNKESTGLGLAIVRHVAETHDLYVSVESQQNSGTRFTVRFPTVGAASDTQEAGKEPDHGILAYHR